VLHQFVGTLALPHALDGLVKNGLDAVAVRREGGAPAAPSTTGRVWLGTTCSGPSAIIFSRLAINPRESEAARHGSG
jgi:hypothetical protein